MKCKQYTIKVIEIGIDDSKSVIEFLEINYELLKNHLLSLKGKMDNNLKSYLEEKGFRYVNNMDLPSGRAKDITLVAPDTNTTVENTPEEEEIEELYQNMGSPLKIIKTPLRSGQYVEYDGSVLITERMNSGAKIAALGSVIALGTVEGDISSVGDCIIMPPTKRGNILFHGVKIDNETLKYPINRIMFVNDRIIIKPLSKKEIN